MIKPPVGLSLRCNTIPDNKERDSNLAVTPQEDKKLCLGAVKVASKPLIVDLRKGCF